MKVKTKDVSKVTITMSLTEAEKLRKQLVKAIFAEPAESWDDYPKLDTFDNLLLEVVR